MRGLALATLFLGLCLINPNEDPDLAKEHPVAHLADGLLLSFYRGVVFFAALVVIWFGA